MKRSILFTLASVAGLTINAYGSSFAEVAAGRIPYKVPKETASFRPGPNLEVVQNNCTGCHSADYIEIQPRGPKFKRDFWQAEVTKMIKVYGAPINEADIGKIVDYLAQTS